MLLKVFYIITPSSAYNRIITVLRGLEHVLRKIENVTCRLFVVNTRKSSNSSKVGSNDCSAS